MELPKLGHAKCAICRQPIEHPRQETTVQTITGKQIRRVHRDCVQPHSLSLRRLEVIPTRKLPK